MGSLTLKAKHRLMCGDSTSGDDVQRLVDGAPVSMWLTDPPYNVAYEGGTKDKLTIINDSMGDSQFREFLRSAYVAADSVMKPGGVFYVWHADSEGYNFRGAAQDAGWTVRQCLIWAKSSLVLGRQDYQWKHEPCLYGWKDGAAHLWASDRTQTTILEFDKPSRNGEHPTMKPVALFEYQMLNNTKPGDVVMDSFGGSGTTLIAAERTVASRASWSLTRNTATSSSSAGKPSPARLPSSNPLANPSRSPDMPPRTYRLHAALIKLLKGVCTAWEDWLKSHPQPDRIPVSLRGIAVHGRNLRLPTLR